MAMISSLTYDYSNMNDVQIASCVSNNLEEKINKITNIKKELDILVHLEKIETNKDNYIFYLKTDKKLENGSLILDDNNITLYFKYVPKEMKLYSIKDKAKEIGNEESCDCSNSTFIEDKALVSLLDENIFFYKVIVSKDDIKEINEDNIIASRFYIKERIFSEKQSENAPDPFLDIKYKISRIDTKKDDKNNVKSIGVRLTNPLWNNNSAYFCIEVPEEELASTLTKATLSSILIEKIDKAQNIKSLIDKLEED